MSVWWSVYGVGGREERATAEAYLVLGLKIRSFVEENLRHFSVTIGSGEDESSLPIL